MFIGNNKQDAIITKIKLSVSFAPHSRIFFVVGSSISTARTTKLNSVFKIYGSTDESVAVMVRGSAL